MSKISPFCPKKYPKFPKLKGLTFYTFHAGFKKIKKDLLIIVFDKLATVSGKTTKSSLLAAPNIWNKKIFNYGKCKTLIVNSGIANAYTGRHGINAVKNYVNFASKKFKCSEKEVYVSSTGVIGANLDYTKINIALKNINYNEKSSVLEAAKTIMTTDTFAKVQKRQFKYRNKIINILGIAKGSGMIAPNMATMLAYVFVDVPVSKKILDKILTESIDDTFNSITVDGETSTNDTVILFAINSSQERKISNKNDSRYSLLKNNIKSLMENLAQQIVMDGEGVSKFITINIKLAKTISQAKKIAFAIGESALVKTAIAGEDPNWGRIIAAIGKSGEKVNSDKIKLKIGKYVICNKGHVVKNYKEKVLQKYMKNKKIEISVELGLGKYSKRIWASDLTKRYVEINSDYRT